jgi:predicted ATP-grasp superfamily ATP-dependent carboligase
LLTLVTVQPYLQKHPFLLQEYVRGTGKGLFALYDRGQAIAFFEHRRIREKPPSGGVSVLSESCAADPVLVANSRRLLDYANWDGVAMVEYKVSDQGVAYLMEVNARFWGSLQLAVDAGVDFPYMLFQSTVGESPQFDGTYRIGIRNRWLLGDLDSLYLRLKSTAGVAGNSRPRWRALADFLNFCDRNTYFEVNRWDDMKPFLVELAAYVGIISR